MLILLQILLQVFGFTLLSLSLQRHYNEVLGQRTRLTKRLSALFRCAGFTLLIVAIFNAIYVWGTALGLVYSFATATLVATALAIIFAYFVRIKALVQSQE